MSEMEERMAKAKDEGRKRKLTATRLRLKIVESQEGMDRA
jgi:hypothetical protein